MASQTDGGLRPLFQTNIPHFHWQSVETGGTGKGVPDSNFCHQGLEAWIEFKWTAEWAVTLAPEQIGWHMRRHRAGGRTFVAIRRRVSAGARRVEDDSLYLYAGRHAIVLREHGLRGDVHPLGVWSGGPARWDWSAVAAALLG